jgi:hypothetical protein
MLKKHNNQEQAEIAQYNQEQAEMSIRRIRR